VQPGVDDRDRGVLREQAEQLGVLSTEADARVGAEHHAGSDDLPGPLDGHRDRGVQAVPVRRGDMSAAHLAVAVEHHRRPVGHHRSGRTLTQRENLALLATNSQVGLLAVGPRGLVDGGDRPCSAAEQNDGAAQDPLQQRLQAELAGQVLDRAGQRVDLFVRGDPSSHHHPTSTS
jgi:hypothetical protein